MTGTTAFDSNISNNEMKEQVQKTLNELISLNRDAVEGYERAAELLENEQYKEICQEYAKLREGFIDQLSIMSKTYSGEPTDNQSVSSILHSAWMSLRDIISDDDSAVFAECDRGEEVAVESYQEAIADDLPSDVEALLRSQHFLLQGSYERIHRLSAALSQ